MEARLALDPGPKLVPNPSTFLGCFGTTINLRLEQTVEFGDFPYSENLLYDKEIRNRDIIFSTTQVRQEQLAVPATYLGMSMIVTL